MRGNGSSCSRAKRTEVPVAVPRTQVRAKVELSRKEHQPQQKGGDSDFVAGAKHAYSHCRPKISPLVHQQNEGCAPSNASLLAQPEEPFSPHSRLDESRATPIRVRKITSWPHSDRTNLLFLRYKRLRFRKLRPVRPAWAHLRELGVKRSRPARIAGRLRRSSRAQQPVEPVRSIPEHDPIFA